MPLLQSGQLYRSDLGWADGMANWQTLEVMLGLPPAGPQYAMPYAQTGTLSYAHGGVMEDTRPLPWKVPLVCAIIQIAMLSVDTFLQTAVYPINPLIIFTNNPGWEVYVVVDGIMAISYILMIIFGSILHYRCWNSLPAHLRSTTPGKAIGLYFVPIFNFFWIFVSYFNLAKHYADWGRATGVPSNPQLPSLAILLGCVWDISWILGFIASANGLMPVPVFIANAIIFVLRVMIYRGIVRQAHATNGHL